MIRLRRTTTPAMMGLGSVFLATLIGVYSFGVADEPDNPSEQSSPQESIQVAAVKNIRAGQDTGVPAKKPMYKGSEGCANCHERQIKSSSSRPSRQSRDFCTLNETILFDENDKHLLSYELLDSELGRKMGRNLGWNVLDRKECLSCHVNWRFREGHAKPLDYEYGVSCEACHGPASEWEALHYAKTWRTKPIEQKEALGMVDVRNPIRRAEQCFSCHIGNSSQGKVVTHDMYAAGHPPLPGVEIETFISNMPPHWRTLREKGDFEFKTEFIKATCKGFSDRATTELSRTKSVLIGSVMALREAINLVATQANDQKESWPELAVFDCQACHHDLRGKSWRLQRGYGKNVPGRPQMFYWTTALVKVGVQHVSKDNKNWDEFTQRLEKLQAEFNARPFGRPDQINAAVGGEDGILAWLDGITQEILVAPCGPQEARQAMMSLCELGPTDYPDYHSARQIAWAIKSIYTELNTDYIKFPQAMAGESLLERRRREINEIQQHLAWAKKSDGEVPEIGKSLWQSRWKSDLLFTKIGLDKSLTLQLPAGQGKKEAGKPRESRILAGLTDALDSISNYDPATFRQQLVKLKQELEDNK